MKKKIVIEVPRPKTRRKWIRKPATQIKGSDKKYNRKKLKKPMEDSDE